MTTKTWRQRCLEPLTRLLRGDASSSRRRAAGRKRVLLRLEELECRLTPSSATLQFNIASETVNEAAGTFSVPVTITGAVAPVITTFVTGVNSPSGLAFDAAGNLYVADHNTNTVSKVTAAGVVSVFASGFTNPDGLAFDAAGNLYVGNYSITRVNKVTPTGVVSTYIDGIANPAGLAVDAAGNLYVGQDDGNNKVLKVTPAGVVTTFASGFAGPEYLTFDSAGNLYVASGGGGIISKVTPAGIVNTIASAYATPQGLAFDAAGNLFVASSANDLISKFISTVTVPYTLGGTAVAGTDYSGVTSGVLTFPTGQTTENITGTLIDDGSPDASKTITFTLGTPSNNVTLGGPTVNTLTIGEPANNPAPILTSISQTSANVGDPNTTVTLTGSGFVNGSTADFNGSPITTTFVSATQLTAVIPASDLTTAGADSITVVNSGPGGGTSAAQSLTVQTFDQRFLSHVYLDLLHRDIDPDSLTYWQSVLNSPGANRVNVVQIIERSQEYYTIEALAVYQQYLHRSADAGGLAGSVNFLAAGNTVEQLIAAIVSDPGREFYNGQGGGAYQGFLAAFFQDALGRQIDSGAQQFFANSTPAQAAAAILSSSEYHTDLVLRDYAILLDRGGDSGDQFWIDGLNAGLRNETVTADIMGINEYYGKTAP